MTEAEWCRLLNGYVFFWPTEDRLLSLLRARAYRNDEHDVITISTEELVDRYEDRIRLSRLNSGSTLYPNAPKRGRDTFRRLEEFNEKDVVEIAVEDSVPAIAEMALLVERRRQDQILRTLYRR